MKIRPYAGTGTVTDISRAQYNVNKATAKSGGGGASIELGEHLIDVVAANVDGKWTPINPSTCKPFTLQKVTMSADIPDRVTADATFTLKTTNIKDVSTNDIHTGTGTGLNNTKVDSDGRLWFTRDSKDTHDSETYRFTHITAYNNASPDTARASVYLYSANSNVSWVFDDGYTGKATVKAGSAAITYPDIEKRYTGTLLLGHRVDDNRSSTTTMIPTTGAPSSDLLAPAIVIAAGLMFLGVTVTRRRRD